MADKSVTVGSGSGGSDSASANKPRFKDDPVLNEAEIVEPNPQYEVYGEYTEVEDHDGTMTQIFREYVEPVVVSELADNQRGKLISS